VLVEPPLRGLLVGAGAAVGRRFAHALDGGLERYQTSAAGATRNAIAAIPPRDGQTLLTSAVNLSPNVSTLTVGFGLADGPAGFGSINYSGVTFVIRANGTEVLRRTTNVAGWQTALVDITPWRGRPVLFELITDADGDQLFDFAYYADLTIR